MSSGRSSLKARRVPGSARTGAAAVAMTKRMAGRKGSYSAGRSVPAMTFQTPSAAKAGEVKGVDTDISQQIIATLTTNGGIDVLNLIQPGSGSWNRIGRKTVLKSVRIKAQADWLVAPTVATGVYREASLRGVLVWDSGPTGTIPTFDNIFGTTLQDGTEQTTSFLDPLKYDGMERYRVIKDMCWDAPPIPVSSTGTGPQNRVTCCIDEYIRLPNLQSNYSGQSTPQTIADIASGALYLIWRASADSGNITTTLDGMVRLRYYD